MARLSYVLDIRTQFGDKVLCIVEGCTDSETVPKPPWKQRKQHYIDHVCEVDDSTRLVSCADKLHNARAIVSDLRVLGDALFDRFGGGKQGTLWVLPVPGEYVSRASVNPSHGGGAGQNGCR